MMKSTAKVSTGTLRVPGADVYYEVRGAGPLIVLHAAPMDAASFAALADLLATDHTVLTSDPRGINHSSVDDRTAEVTPDTRADDLARLLDHLDSGPAAIFGSSGGAVSALALVHTHPDLAHTVIAHEPPLAELLPDRDDIWVAHDEMVATYLAGDRRGYWQKFLRTANIELPAEVFEMMFGGSVEGQQAADEQFAVECMDRATTFWKPDLAALKDADVRCVVGIGQESAEQLCDRTSRRLAAELGLSPAMFPGDHIGFVHEPEAFAAQLRNVLTD